PFVSSVPLLLPFWSSWVADDTVIHSFPTRPSSDLVMMIVIGGAAPTARFIARVQLTLVLVPLQLQSVPEALWKITPAGSVSLTVIGKAAGLNPRHLTTTVAVIVSHATTGSGLSLLL